MHTVGDVFRALDAATAELEGVEKEARMLQLLDEAIADVTEVR